MALMLQVIADSLSRYVLSRRNNRRDEVNPAEFYKSCSKLCSCDSIEDLIETSSSLIKKLLSSSQPVHVFRHTRNNRYVDYATDVNYSSDFIKIPDQDKTFHISIVSKSDELVSNGYFKADETVLLIPVFPEKRVRHDFVFVTGSFDGVHQTELLEVLCEHITSCFDRLHKNFKIQDDRGGFMTALFKLCADLNQHNAAQMQVKIMNYLSQDLNCEKCSLLIVDEEFQNLFCQVVGNEVLEVEHYFPLRGGFFGNICRVQEPRIMEQFTTNEQEILQNLFKVSAKSFLCVPIVSQSLNDVVALVCACNKSNGDKFTVADVSNIQSCLRYTWTLLTSSLALQKETKAKDECQAMLQIARNLFSHLDDVTILLGEIIQEARTLTNAERCSVFLVNKERNELVAKVFDGIVTVDEGMNEVRLPLSQGIAGHVATTGQTLNITDAYAHPLFYRGIDEATGFKTRNILCFPIKDDKGCVVGVSQLCNKIKGHSFTKYDVELAERFAVFSGISISHSLLYKQVIEVQCRNQLANELMTYHMKIRPEEVESCLRSLPSDITHFHPDFSKFIYAPRTLGDELKLMASVQMYIDLGLVSRFHISTKTLTKFVLMVKEGYRSPPYHNWDHAFSVGHHAYLLAKNLNLADTFGDLEVLALLTASLCHDIDHRGTNNAFQVSSKSTLAALYSSQGSVLEQHHFAQTLSILNSGSCNIFENMSKNDYVHVLDLIKEIILATDLAHHLQILPNLEKIVERNMKPSECDDEQKSLILDLCMTACDLSDLTKDWKNSKATAHLIYNEFFHQGDMEKSMGALPALINDRERACIPELQVNFMQHIAGPVYRILATLFSAYSQAYDNYTSNINRWKRVLHKFKELKLANSQGLDFLTDEFERQLFEEA